MTRRLALLIPTTLLFLSTQVYAQSRTDSDRHALEALVQELRLLRRTIETRGAAQVRSQLLVGQLGVQDDRVARAQEALDRASTALDAALWKRDQAAESLGELNRALENTVEDPRRSELERRGEAIRKQLAAHERRATHLRTQESEAQQRLRGEQARYEQIEESLRNLDQRLRQAAP